MENRWLIHSGQVAGVGRWLMVAAVSSWLVALQVKAVEPGDYPPVDLPEGYVAAIDVVYHQVDSWEGRVDIYRPAEPVAPTPLMINIHGGGWNHGVKESQRGFGSWFANGWAVANVEYRLSPQAPAPAAVQDVRCALIHLLNHADQLNIDRDKVVVMGGSAGGHLALMAGLMGDDRRFDGDCGYDGEVRVAAIIDKYGVTDLEPVMDQRSPKWWLGPHAGDVDFARSVSPINWVTKDSPPVFVTHGNADRIVPFGQSEALVARLREAGVGHEFLVVKGGGHGKFSEAERDRFRQALWTFLASLGL